MSAENASLESAARITGLSPSPRTGASSAPNSSLLGPAAMQGADFGVPRSLNLKHISRASSFTGSPDHMTMSPASTPSSAGKSPSIMSLDTPKSGRASARKSLSDASVNLAKARARLAQKMNDSMVYLDGPQIYTCAQCRTHLTSHDDIISKSFHGRHGRAYLFDQCVNVTIGPAEDRLLITGLHSVCDIFCKRCKGMVGWTYAKAYESSQKYKEGKFIIEKINLHLEESSYYAIGRPAGERADKWRLRSMSWGSESFDLSKGTEIVYEYHPFSFGKHRSLTYSPRHIDAPASCPTTRTRYGARDSPTSPLPIAPDL